eukprot:gene18224-20752_t
MSQVVPIFNEPQSGNKFTHGNGCKLHFRVAKTAPGVVAKSAVFFVPGYSNHVNSPEVKRMNENLANKGTIVVSIDMQGHGYSEGLRCYVPRYDHFVRDVVHFVSCFMDEHAANNTLFFDPEPNSFNNSDLLAFRKLPFFIMAVSMGGGITVIAAHILWNMKRGDERVFPQFRGVLFQAPFTAIAQPGCLTASILKCTVGSCASTMQLPASMSETNVVQMLYKSPESQAYFEMDTWGKPGALGWNQGMRWGTVLMFLDLGAAIDAICKDIAYPFLILHDPADELTDIAGSKQLFQESLTDLEHKQLIEVPGYLHGILVNETDKVCEYSINWMNQMLALSDVPEINTINVLHK